MKRDPSTAMGAASVHEGWRDHTAYARRAHNHGRLLPMERPAGEPSLLAGTGILLLIAAAVWFAITAFAEPPANASGAAEQPAALYDHCIAEQEARLRSIPSSI